MVGSSRCRRRRGERMDDRIFPLGRIQYEGQRRPGDDHARYPELGG